MSHDVDNSDGQAPDVTPVYSNQKEMPAYRAQDNKLADKNGDLSMRVRVMQQHV